MMMFAEKKREGGKVEVVFNVGVSMVLRCSAVILVLLDSSWFSQCNFKIKQVVLLQSQAQKN